MPLPCWPLPPLKIAHLAHKVTHGPVRAAKHGFHHLHRHKLAAAIYRGATNVACRSIPRWVLQIAAIAPIALPLHPGSYGPAQEAPARPGAESFDPDLPAPDMLPSAAVLPAGDQGSTLMSFPPDALPATLAGDPGGGTPSAASPEPAIAAGSPPSAPTPATTPAQPIVPAVRNGAGQGALPAHVAAAVAAAEFPAPVPEPSTLLVVTSSAGVLMILRRRRIARAGQVPQ